MREHFWIAGTLSLRLRGNNTLNIYSTLGLTNLKRRLTDHFNLFYQLYRGVAIHDSLRYTEHLSGLNFGLVKDCRQLYIIVLVITSSGYPFFNKAFIKLSSSAIFGFEQIIKARWTRVFIRLILTLGGQNEPHRVYDPVNVGLRLIDVRKPKLERSTKTSRKRKLLLYSNHWLMSTQDVIGWQCWKSVYFLSSRRKSQRCHLRTVYT